MIVPTNIHVSSHLLAKATASLSDDIGKLSLNMPTGRFFYDKWVLKDEFKDTIWEEILNTLPYDNVGEARIINLDIKTCYTMHADIDDRWHLSFSTGNSFLIDLENQKMFQTAPGIWHSMDAGILHSAVNFGESSRYQLVVRKLLSDVALNNPINVKMYIDNPPTNYRYIFDQYISPKLNRWCKSREITNFCQHNTHVEFDIEQTMFTELKAACNKTNMEIRLEHVSI